MTEQIITSGFHVPPRYQIVISLSLISELFIIIIPRFYHSLDLSLVDDSTRMMMNSTAHGY
jgi:hypothetical protein